MYLSERRVLVTGCAGFIGSHLVDRLLLLDNEVIGVDDMSAGSPEFLGEALRKPGFRLIRGDLLTMDLGGVMEGVEVIAHMAANPDVRVGSSDTSVHFDQNIEATYRLLEAARRAGVRDFLFPSTSTVYGEPSVVPTPESYGPLRPISLYGASKLACEALISAYSHTFDMGSIVFRFANVVGPRSTHNVLHDFIRKLREDPDRLEILGAEPGTCKSYIHVDDCIDAMIVGATRSQERVGIFNIGSLDKTYVREIADIVTEEMGLVDTRYEWTGGVDGGRGWLGDVKLMLLSIERLSALGWRPRMSSSEAIRRAVREILGKGSA